MKRDAREIIMLATLFEGVIMIETAQRECKVKAEGGK